MFEMVIWILVEKYPRNRLEINELAILKHMIYLYIGGRIKNLLKDESKQKDISKKLDKGALKNINNC